MITIIRGSIRSQNCTHLNRYFSLLFEERYQSVGSDIECLNPKSRRTSPRSGVKALSRRKIAGKLITGMHSCRVKRIKRHFHCARSRRGKHGSHRMREIFFIVRRIH